jgi:hypothetical protein
VVAGALTSREDPNAAGGRCQRVWAAVSHRFRRPRAFRKKAIFRIWLVDAGSPVIWAMPARSTVR